MKNNYSYILLFVLLAFFDETQAQQQVSLSLSLNDTISAPFFIKDVIDSRTDKNTIGINEQGQSITVKLGLRNELMRYSDFCIQEQPKQKAFVLELQRFELKGKAGKTQLFSSIDILMPTDSGLVLLFPLSNEIDTNGVVDNVIIDRLIRQLMQQVFAKLNEYYKEPSLYTPSLVLVHPIVKEPVYLGSSEPKEKDRGRLSFMIIGTFQQGKFARSDGLSISHIRISEKENNSVGGLYSLYLVGTDPTTLNRGGAVLKIGFLPMHRLVGPCWIYFPIQVPIVRVTTHYTYGSSSQSTYFGVDASLGLCLMSRKTGFFLGTRGYFVSTTSPIIYNKDFGVGLDFGLKF